MNSIEAFDTDKDQDSELDMLPDLRRSESSVPENFQSMLFHGRKMTSQVMNKFFFEYISICNGTLFYFKCSIQQDMISFQIYYWIRYDLIDLNIENGG